MKPENFPERMVWYSLLGTYGFYLLGGLYLVGSLLGWILLLYLIKKWWNQTPTTPFEQTIRVPWVIWVWIGGMMTMEIALIMGHLDFNLELSLLIKSSIGWAKGWALLALMPLAGCLNIRPALLYRAACIVSLHTLLLLPLFILAYALHLPETVYVSPLKFVGGPGPDFFEFRLYEIDPENGLPRWRLFTPWAPALGLMGNVYFFLALQEANRRWKWIGIAGSILMCTICASRLAVLCIPLVLVLLWLLTHWKRPLVLFSLGFISFILGLIVPTLMQLLASFQAGFRAVRENSSRVRDALGRIALDRWWNEAPIWGHGVVEPGLHSVEFMPIGSHHTWYGLLFVKGVVGLLGLALPISCSGVDLMFKIETHPSARAGLAMLMILVIYTFGENLEILAYLFWPALLMIGIAHQDKSTTPPTSGWGL
ncbi:capsular biosynthesis protein [Neosynechococcus sphagnicola]|uniref:capsular biosynthesis protein n=1 Tax=Neosynechococcus sphagnicola TaxID=1501145 RepID=UPI000690D138|nr:capsular biosynthesis protein [Neosynechococcus sphagnicola]